jgi:hypothetical protein
MTAQELIHALADRAEAAAVPIDGERGGAVHRFAHAQGCPPAKSFFVVLLLTAELADREARREGYANQGDRAAARAFAHRTPRNP